MPWHGLMRIDCVTKVAEMSHIPASAMPHAQSNEDAAQNESSAEPKTGNGTTDAKEGGAAAAFQAVKEQAQHARDAASSAAASAAGKGGEAAKAAAEKVNALPTYAKILGAAAVVGGIAAVAALPFLQHPEDTGRAKRKKNKAAKKA